MDRFDTIDLVKKLDPLVKEILEKINNRGYEAYLVGGFVRDYLLHKTTYDYDICTNAPAKELFLLFHKTINSYGSFRIKEKNITIDITIYREEKAYHNRKPMVEPINSLLSDLLRRDFTINTICMDKEGQIIDLLNGQKDLKEKRIRMVGDPTLKIQEDPLRILRAIRFFTTLDFTFDSKLEKILIENKNLLKNLSTYRIKQELSKILSSPYYKKGLNFLKENHFDILLGISYQEVVYTKETLGMWAQIKFLKEFPFTKKEKENIVKIQEILKIKKISKEVLYQYGLSLSLIAGEILQVEKKTIVDLYNEMPIHSKKDLQIDFSEIQHYFPDSSKIKEIEKQLIQEVLKGALQNTKEELQTYLKNLSTR